MTSLPLVRIETVRPKVTRAGCDEAQGKDWTVSVDSAVVGAHQHAVGPRRTRPANQVRSGAGKGATLATAPPPTLLISGSAWAALALAHIADLARLVVQYRRGDITGRLAERAYLDVMHLR